MKNCDLHIKNGDLPIRNGDLPIKNGDLPIKNGDLPIKNRIHVWNIYLHWDYLENYFRGQCR